MLLTGGLPVVADSRVCQLMLAVGLRVGAGRGVCWLVLGGGRIAHKVTSWGYMQAVPVGTC